MRTVPIRIKPLRVALLIQPHYLNPRYRQPGRSGIAFQSDLEPIWHLEDESLAMKLKPSAIFHVAMVLTAISSDELTDNPSSETIAV
jgi:hypothetical protein